MDDVARGRLELEIDPVGTQGDDERALGRFDDHNLGR